MPESPREDAAGQPLPTRFAAWLDALVPAVYGSDADLARAIGTHQSSIVRWRRGTTPSTESLLKLSRLTGTSMDVLARLVGYRDDPS